MNHHPHRKSPRIAGFDYSSGGSYFVTICTLNMELRFGQVTDGIVELNEAGRLVSQVLEEDVARFPGFELDSFVLMPNHLHALIHVGTDATVSNVSLVKFVNSFKSRSTVSYTQGVRDGQFLPYAKTLWQRSFHDRVLRDHKAIDAARAYIEGNPSRWELKPR